MSGITYAHPRCFYCQGWANEAETEANRRPGAEAAQVGDEHHWARYYKDPTQAPTHGGAPHESEIEMTETTNDFEEALDTWDLVADANALVWTRDENECARFWMYGNSWALRNASHSPAPPFANAYDTLVIP